MTKQLSPKTKAQIARIRKMQEMLNKDRSEYTDEDKAIVRQCINKHTGTSWATDGYEGIDE